MTRILTLVFIFAISHLTFSQINVQWEARLNDPVGNFIDKAVDLALDASGNTYVVGTAYDGASYDVVTVKYNSAGVEIWRSSFGGVGIDEAGGIFLDSNNDVVITGSTFIGGSDYDIFTAKYNGTTGAQIWSVTNAGSNFYDAGKDVTVDGLNNVIITGVLAVDGTDNNWVVIKYNSAGVVQWTQSGGTVGASNDIGKVVITDAANNIYVAGHRQFSSGTTYFDFLLLKFLPAGGAPTINVTRDSGNGKLDTPYAIDLDAAGNIYMAGQGFTNVVDEEDYMTVKFNSAGTFQWIKLYAGDAEGLDRINAIDVDAASGTVYVTGRSKSIATSEDYYTIAYNTAGTELWNKRYSSPGLEFDEASDISLSSTGFLYITGYSYITGSSNDYTTLKYDVSGNLIWETIFDGPSSLSDQAIKMKLDPSENIFVTGSSHGGPSTNLDYSTIKYCQLETIASNDTSICLGQNVDLTGSGGINITWTVLSGDAGSLSCSVCPTTTVDPTVTTVYSVSCESASGCIDYDSVIVTVNPIPTPIIYNSGPLSFCVGDSVTLSTDIYPTYSWAPGLQTTNSIKVYSAGTHTLTITDVNGCQNSANATVATFSLPNVSAGVDFSLCPGDSGPLGATGASTYQWNVNTTLSQLNIANPISTPVTPQTYIVTGTDLNGCKDKDTVVVSLFTIPTVNAGTDGQVCVGQPWPLNATGSATSFLWTAHPSLSLPLNIPNPTATPTSLTEYFVTGTDGNGCQNIDSVTISTINLPGISAGVDKTICENDNVQIFATGGISYSWNIDPTLSCTLCSNPFASPLVMTTYTVSGTDINGCSNTDQVVVFVNNLPNVSAGPDTSVCVDGSIQLQATGASTYVWNANASLSSTTVSNPTATPTAPTTYIVTGTDGNMCENTAQVTVTINALPAIFAGFDVAICIGDSTQLNGLGGTVCVWNFNTTLSDFIICDPWAKPTALTTYYLSGTDANGCTNYDTVVVDVNPLPAVPFIVLDSCFISSSYTTGNQWYLDGNPILGETNDTANYCLIAQNGAYTVLYTDANGCSAFSDVTNTILITDVGIEDLTNEFGVKLYPNPTNSILNIELENGADLVYVMSMSGQVIYVENNLAIGLSTLDLSILAPGTYVIQFVKGDSVVTRRIVKQ